MKLSLKFFCIAYIIVLVSTGIGGVFLVNTTTDTLWDSRMEQFASASKYACDSFISFTDISAEKITDSQLNGIKNQIKSNLDMPIKGITVYTADNAPALYSYLKDNQGYNGFLREGGSLLAESVCRLSTGAGVYYLCLYSDFTDIEQQCNSLWKWYSVTVLALSVISGGFLYITARRIATPINRLSNAANGIASGDYGKTVNIKSRDFEIKRLAESFNTMSKMVEKTIADIREESEKRNMFVADFTHEIKTPMTAIIGYAEMLNSYSLTDSEIKQASKAIYKEGKRLEKLSLQLLDLYVYRNDNPQLEEINLNDLTKQLETTLIFLSRKYKVGFSVDFEDVTVMANPVLLMSLLYNLADNAFKASDPEGSITLFCRRYNERTRIYVKDSGRGISPENIKYLTEPFYREDKARSRRQGGAGLGLALCREIAEIHGTKLDFNSTPGIGTVVSFDLNNGGESDE